MQHNLLLVIVANICWAPTGTVGRARTTPDLHGAVRSGTAGCGLNRDHWPCTGRGSYASTHAHLGTAGRETILGSRAASGPEELRDSERSHGCRRDIWILATYDVVRHVRCRTSCTYDIVRATYDIVLNIARTMSYVRYTGCRRTTSYVRHRTSHTMSYVNIRHRTVIRT